MSIKFNITVIVVMHFGLSWNRVSCPFTTSVAQKLLIRTYLYNMPPCKSHYTLHTIIIFMYIHKYLYLIIIHNYVTGFAKTVPKGTRIEIPFIAWHESQTLALHRYPTHRPMDGQVCFYRRSFANPVKPQQSTTGSMEPLRGTNEATCCVKLLPTTVYVCQVDCGCFCALLSTQCCFLSHCGWFLKISLMKITVFVY